MIIQFKLLLNRTAYIPCSWGNCSLLSNHPRPNPHCCHLAYVMSTACRSCQQKFSTAQQREKHLQSDCLLKEWTLHLTEGTVVVRRNAVNNMLVCPCKNQTCNKEFAAGKSLIKHLKKTGAWVTPSVRHFRFYSFIIQLTFPKGKTSGVLVIEQEETKVVDQEKQEQQEIEELAVQEAMDDEPMEQVSPEPVQQEEEADNDDDESELSVSSFIYFSLHILIQSTLQYIEPHDGPIVEEEDDDGATPPPTSPSSIGPIVWPAEDYFFRPPSPIVDVRFSFYVYVQHQRIKELFYRRWIGTTPRWYPMRIWRVSASRLPAGGVYAV